MFGSQKKKRWCGRLLACELSCLVGWKEGGDRWDDPETRSHMLGTGAKKEGLTKLARFVGCCFWQKEATLSASRAAMVREKRPSVSALCWPLWSDQDCHCALASASANTKVAPAAAGRSCSCSRNSDGLEKSDDEARMFLERVGASELYRFFFLYMLLLSSSCES